MNDLQVIVEILFKGCWHEYEYIKPYRRTHIYTCKNCKKEIYSDPKRIVITKHNPTPDGNFMQECIEKLKEKRVPIKKPTDNYWSLEDKFIMYLKDKYSKQLEKVVETLTTPTLFFETLANFLKEEI